MNNMEDKLIKEKLDEYGLTAEDLTAEQLKELRQEVQVELAGVIVLDSVLDSVPLFRADKRMQ